MLNIRLRHRFTAWLCAMVVTAVGLGLTTPGYAQTEYDPVEHKASVDKLLSLLEQPEVDERTLQNIRTEAITLRTQSNDCSIRVAPELAKLESELEVLGEFTEGEEAALQESRVQTQEKYNKLSAQAKNCELGLSRTNSIIDTVDQTLRAISSARLSTRGYTVVNAIAEAPKEIISWPESFQAAVVPSFVEGTDITTALWGVLIAIVIGVLTGWYLRHQFRTTTLEKAQQAGPLTQTLHMLTPFYKRLPLILGAFGMASALVAVSETPYYASLAIRFAMGILFYGFGLFLIDWCTGQSSPVQQISGSAEELLQPLRRRFRYLIIALIASIVVLGPLWLGVQASDTFKILRMIAILGIVIPLYMILAAARRFSWLSGRFRAVRTLAFFGITLTVISELLGYHNFSNFMLRGVVLSSLAVFVLWIMLWQTSLFIEWLNSSDQSLAKMARVFMGFSDEKRRPGVGLYQLVVDTSVWLGFLIAMFYIWDSTGTVLNKIWIQVTDGVEVGNIKIVPADLIAAIAIFAIIIVVTGWIKRWIDRRWLEHITRDRGTRDAFITVVGYIGFIVATVVALSLAGVNVTGLAVIAGALSVGIGFGLQSIANNFISGIILLFERPIKAGDFVSVGEVEGFVKRISIRSTEIETLDNQDVLVPNSELVSGRVTNWVLHNPYGRLRLKIGVAYGSDVERVKEILEAVAHDHPEVITDGRAAGPKALFMGFGDSSLDFELRVRILRIPKRFDVTSELNFDIDKRFREGGITIPFPQRDLHVKDWSESGTNPAGKKDDQHSDADEPDEPDATKDA